MVTHLLAYCEKEKLRKFYLGLGWEKVPNWECLLVHRKQGLFLSVYVDDINMDGRKQKYGSNVEDIDGTCSS